MVQVPENDPDTQCFIKAKRRGQKAFTLVEQDASAVETIAYWILRNINTAPAKKLREALNDCLQMREFKDKKQAD